MTALPASNTPRVFIDYTVGGEQHTMSYRYPETGSLVTALSTLAEMWAFMDSEMYATTIDGARFAEVNSNVTNPAVWPGDPSYGTGTPAAGQEMKFFSMVGKDPIGKRWRVEWFGVTQAIPSTWRLAVGINPSMDDMFDHLQAALTATTLCSIAGQSVLMRTYYNFKYADLEIAKKRD